MALKIFTCFFSLTCAIAPLPVKRFPNILALKVPNNSPRNPPICSFPTFLIVFLTPFVNNPGIQET